MSHQKRTGAQVALNVLNTLIIILAIFLLGVGAYFIYIMNKNGADNILQIIQNTEGTLSSVDAIKNQVVTMICYAVADIIFGIYGKMASHDSLKLKKYEGMALGFVLLSVYTLVEHYVLHVNVGLYFFPVVQIVVFGICMFMASVVAEETL